MNTLELWNKFCKPPESALRRIQGGKLKGKFDINPQWRYKALTEVFGPCGVGWKFDVVRKWTEAGASGEVLAFVDISFYYRHEGEWAGPIHGTGGSTLVAEEKGRLVSNDEAWKMSLTDALGAAAKMIGVAAAVYLGQFDGKYAANDRPVDGPVDEERHEAPMPPSLDEEHAETKEPPPSLSAEEVKQVKSVLSKHSIVPESALAYIKSIGGLEPYSDGLVGIKRKFAKRIISAPDKFVAAYKDYIIKKAEEANE